MKADKKKTIRKCPFCEDGIDINKVDNTFFVDGSKYIHCQCFVKHKTSLKKGAWGQGKCDDYIKQKLMTVEDDVAQRTIKKRLTDWVFEAYDISYLPTYFYTKLESIFSGTFKGQSRPVLPEHLLDMWQQKKLYLDKIATRNAAAGKEISGVNRINYDIAIVLSKYDAYLDWKAQREVDKKSIVESATEIKNAPIKPVFQPGKSKNNKLDINEILDEI